MRHAWPEGATTENGSCQLANLTEKGETALALGSPDAITYTWNMHPYTRIDFCAKYPYTTTRTKTGPESFDSDAHVETLSAYAVRFQGSIRIRRLTWLQVAGEFRHEATGHGHLVIIT